MILRFLSVHVLLLTPISMLDTLLGVGTSGTNACCLTYKKRDEHGWPAISWRAFALLSPLIAGCGGTGGGRRKNQLRARPQGIRTLSSAPQASSVPESQISTQATWITELLE